MTTPGPENLPRGLGGSARPADSAGTPWEGRTLPGGDFPDDTGEADPALTRALERDDEPGLVRTLANARLFAAVTAMVGEAAETAETAEGASGVTADKEADMAVVLLDHPDGRKALPVFSSLRDLSAFDSSLRPVPVRAPRAAQAAVEEHADLMVLDCASEQAFEVRGSMVRALAQGREWLPAHEDPVVREAVERVCGEYSEVKEVQLTRGVPDGEGVLQVVLTLATGFDRAGIEALVTAVAEGLAQDAEARARIDGLGFTIT